MPDTVIKIENLGKKYRISHQRAQRYLTFREILMDRAKRIGKKAVQPFTGGNPPLSDIEDFWALKDVSFEVKQGERMGIIGRNGAGKSTLLKILSRITEPATGRVSIKGRIASLLEVGTGFHPELTGRENIFLNGAILGMSRTEIKKNFDAIVDFAGVGQFLDTPVKHYSSGMYVRLAFAVAAHLDTEILLIDEVLAVGDAEFQKKCMGKMDEVSHKQGRTILFVSHNMPMVGSLCESGVWLEQGKVRDAGLIAPLLAQYINPKQLNLSVIEFLPGQYGDDVADLLSVSAEKQTGEPSLEFAIDEPVCLKMQYRVKQQGHAIYSYLHLFGMEGRVFSAIAADCPAQDEGVYVVTCRIPGNFLNDGHYSASFSLGTITPGMITHFHVQDILDFIVADNMLHIPTRGPYRGAFGGMMRPLLAWTNQKIH